MRKSMLVSCILLLSLLSTNLAYAECEGDFDGNGSIDGTDLAVFAGNFGLTNCTMSSTLKSVLDEGVVRVGINSLDFPGFFDTRHYEGLEVDLAAALAAAIFGDKTKVSYIETTAATRFTGLQNASFHVLFRVATFTLHRDTSLNLNFAPIYFYDGQTIMTDLGSNLSALDGSSIGVLAGTAQENLNKFMSDNHLTYTEVLYPNRDEMYTAYSNNAIDAISFDRSQLNAYRSYLPDPLNHTVLSEMFSKEPLSPVVRHGDENWYDIVKWVIYALIRAEELGLTSANIDTFFGSSNKDIRLFLGREGSLGADLGLSNDWAYQIIKQVGNYGEIYDRNLGPSTTIPLSRDINCLYKDGGVFYAPSMR